MLLVCGTDRHYRFQKQISALKFHKTEGTKISELMALMHLFFKNNLISSHFKIKCFKILACSMNDLFMIDWYVIITGEL